ncbi:MAG: PH domain-containing protein [Corynebacteriales bacterium]|nr:PH domain-containing protein [Mycobacteriales bacterium]
MNGPRTRQWRVPRKIPVLKSLAGCVFVAIGVVFHSSALSLLVAGGAAAFLFVAAARDFLAPVRLVATPSSVTVPHQLFGHRDIPWAEVDRVRVDTQRRLFGRSTMIEIDTQHKLYFFSPAELGSSAEEVVGEIEFIRSNT